MTEPPTKPPPAPNHTLILLRGIAGAIAGGIAGYFLFGLLLKGRLYGIMIPGTLLGLGAGLAARGKSQVLGAICAVLGIALTLFTEWHYLFAKNHTFLEFVSNVHTLGWQRIAVMLLGVAAAWWFGQGR